MMKKLMYNQSEPVASTFVDANREGWKSVVYEALQDKIDVDDSLESLKEPGSISLEKFMEQAKGVQ